MQSHTSTVKEYLAELTPERRTVIETVREVILQHLPAGYEETMRWGMITYEVPLSIKADTYNKQPLMYAALASQKNHFAVYLSAVYSSEERTEAFKSAYTAQDKKLDMGKSCVRFKKLEDLPLDVIGQTIALLSAEDFVAEYERLRER